jgi:uncharacterized protein (UPF0212 family)
MYRTIVRKRQTSKRLIVLVKTNELTNFRLTDSNKLYSVENSMGRACCDTCYLQLSSVVYLQSGCEMVDIILNSTVDAAKRKNLRGGRSPGQCAEL